MRTRNLLRWSHLGFMALCLCGLASAQGPRYSVLDFGLLSERQLVDINDAGQLLIATGSNEAVRDSYVYTPGGGTHAIGHLSPLVPDTSVITSGVAINASGQVAGNEITWAGSNIEQSRVQGFAYTPGSGMVKLDDLAHDDHYQHTQAFALNASGQVTGFSYLDSGWAQAFVYTPGTGTVLLPGPADHHSIGLDITTPARWWVS